MYDVGLFLLCHRFKVRIYRDIRVFFELACVDIADGAELASFFKNRGVDGAYHAHADHRASHSFLLSKVPDVSATVSSDTAL